MSINYNAGCFMFDIGVTDFLSTELILSFKNVLTISGINEEHINKFLSDSELNVEYTHLDIHRNNSIRGVVGSLEINGERHKFMYYYNCLVIDDGLKNKNFILEKLKLYETGGGESIRLKYPIVTPYGTVFKDVYVTQSKICQHINFSIFKFAHNQHEKCFNPYELGKLWAQSSGNLLIIHGPPGVGKSKSVIPLALGYKSVKKNVRLIVLTPKIVGELDNLVVDALNNESETYIFVLDDFDQLSNKFVRGCGNKVVDSIISLLLQVTDGILPITHIKFVITSNRKIEEIDSALLRPGRLFRRVELFLTTFNQITQGKIKLPSDVEQSYNDYFDKEFNPDEKLTLAEWKFLVDNIPQLEKFIKRSEW